MKLNIDQILEHVLPWDFVVTIGGVDYPTRRPSIVELAAMQGIGGKEIGGIVDLVNSLFVTKPEIYWDVATLRAFLGGYLAYFQRHTDQKKDQGPTAEQMATTAVATAWTDSAGS